jgi:hypothetical protein
MPNWHIKIPPKARCSRYLVRARAEHLSRSEVNGRLWRLNGYRKSNSHIGGRQLGVASSSLCAGLRNSLLVLGLSATWDEGIGDYIRSVHPALCAFSHDLYPRSGHSFLDRGHNSPLQIAATALNFRSRPQPPRYLAPLKPNPIPLPTENL